MSLAGKSLSKDIRFALVTAITLIPCMLIPVVESSAQTAGDVLYQDAELTSLAEKAGTWTASDPAHLQAVRGFTTGVFEPVQQETANQLLARLISIDPDSTPLRTLQGQSTFFAGKPLRLYSRVLKITDQMPVGLNGDVTAPEVPAGTRRRIDILAE